MHTATRVWNDQHSVPAIEISVLGEPMTFFVRTVGDPAKVTAAVRRDVQAVDANVPIYNVRTLEE